MLVNKKPKTNIIKRYVSKLCDMCNRYENETVEHFLFVCDAFCQIRADYLRKIEHDAEQYENIF